MGCLGDPATWRSDDDEEKEEIPGGLVLPKYKLEIYAYVSTVHKQFTSYYNDGYNGWNNQDWTENYLWLDIRNTGRMVLEDIKCTLTSEPEHWDIHDITYVEPCYTGGRYLNFDETTQTITKLFPQYDSSTGRWHSELETTMLLRLSIRLTKKYGIDIDSDHIAETDDTNISGNTINGPYPGKAYEMKFYAKCENADIKQTIRVEVTRDFIKTNEFCPGEYTKSPELFDKINRPDVRDNYDSPTSILSSYLFSIVIIIILIIIMVVIWMFWFSGVKKKRGKRKWF